MARARTDAAPREELRIGYLSEVAHTYLTRLVREGAAHRLTAASLPALPAVDKMPYLLECFSSCWEAALRELERGPPNVQVVIDPEAPEPSAAAPPEPRNLAVGAVVKLARLQSAELNGRHAVVRELVIASKPGRVGVEIDGRTIAVKRENVDLLEPSFRDEFDDEFSN